MLPPKTSLVLSEDFQLRALFTPSSFRQDPDGGFATIDLVASAGASMRRVGLFDGGFEEFDEHLSFEPGAHRNERLASGRAPLLVDHRRHDVRAVVGALSNPRWDAQARTLTVSAKLSRSESDEETIEKIRDGLLVNTSIGYRTFSVRDVTTKDDVRRQIEVIDWEVFEVSILPVGEDSGAYVRTLQQATERTIHVLPKSQPMDPITPPTPAVVPAPAPTPSPTPAPGERAIVPAPTPAPAVDAADLELNRARTIRERLRAARLPADDEFARGLLDSRTVTPDVASSRILERLAGSGSSAPAAGSDEIDGAVRVGAEQGAALCRHLENALLYRARQAEFIDGTLGADGQVAPLKLRAVLQGNPFVHRSLLESGEEFCSSLFGVRGLGRMSKMDRAGAILRPRIADEQRSLGLGAGHSTSDFPGILQNITNKVLRGRFELAPNTWGQWTGRGSLADYKQATRAQLGASPRLLQVREGAEYQYGTLGEQGEPIILAKWGRIVSLTREAMVNDDLNAFARIAGQYGMSAMQLIADLVYAHLTGNTVMSDGLGIFHATHKNLVTAAGNALAVTPVAALSSLRTLARLQTHIDPGLAGTENAAFFQSVAIEHLRVPAELETAAQQVTTSINAQQVGNVNPFQGSFRTVMAEPRLSAASAIAFYGMSDPAAQDTVEVAFMQGEDGPMVETRPGFERDGVDIKVRMDVGTAPTDFRGLYKNNGTA